MRMWMIPPELLCRKHLLGEHVECHMVAGSLLKGRTASIKGLCDYSMLEPQHLAARHEALAKEIARRDMTHASDMPELPKEVPHGDVDVEESYYQLMKRCDDCRALMQAAGRKLTVREEA